MFEFFIDGEIIKFINMLQKPKIIVESGYLLVLLHDLAQVEIIDINSMHVHVLPFVLLYTKIRLFKWCLENIVSVVFYSVLLYHKRGLLLFVHIFYLFRFIIKILPYYIIWFFLLAIFQTFLPFDDR